VGCLGDNVFSDLSVAAPPSSHQKLMFGVRKLFEYARKISLRNTEISSQALTVRENPCLDFFYGYAKQEIWVDWYRTHPIRQQFRRAIQLIQIRQHDVRNASRRVI